VIGGLAVVSDDGMRASDSDREKVAEILRTAYAEGRLSLDEFDDRTTAAYASRTWGDLRGLTSDLPAGASLSGPPPAVPVTPLAQQAMPAMVPRPPVRRPMFIPFLPLAFLFLVLATSAHAAVLFVPAVIMLLVWRSVRRGPGQRPRDGLPPRPGGGIPPRPGGTASAPPRTGSGPA
jgi:hypothetical protein